VLLAEIRPFCFQRKASHRYLYKGNHFFNTPLVLIMVLMELINHDFSFSGFKTWINGKVIFCSFISIPVGLIASSV
jgi:hypothetical protein